MIVFQPCKGSQGRKNWVAVSDGVEYLIVVHRGRIRGLYSAMALYNTDAPDGTSTGRKRVDVGAWVNLEMAKAACRRTERQRADGLPVKDGGLDTSKRYWPHTKMKKPRIA